MAKSGLTCPYCGRVFVIIGRYLEHLEGCSEQKQAELDREWEARQKRMYDLKPILQEIFGLKEEDRLLLLHDLEKHICIHCGSSNPHCTCWINPA
jgi:hypothetical protein